MSQILSAAAPRICLVTPCLNAGAFLRQAVESVVKQPGFEQVDYVLMDGGSVDSSREVIAEYAPQLKHWQSGADGGLYRAVEEGFKHSDAEIMGWLNADDMLCPWTIRLVLDIFTQLPEVSFITSKHPLVADKSGRVFRSDLLPGVNRNDFLEGLNLPGQDWPATNFISQESTFWRRSLWDRAGGIFDHSLALACDFELWSRFLDLCELHVIDAPMAVFRVHGGNLSVCNKGDYAREARSVLARRGWQRPADTETLERRVQRARAVAAGVPATALARGSAPVRMSEIQFDEARGRFFVAERSGEHPAPLLQQPGSAEAIRREIETHRPELVSFDVFDTLLWRPFRRPTDLFLHLAFALESKGVITPFDHIDIARRRVEAERVARSGTGGPEVSLDEIAGELCRSLRSKDPQTWAEAELFLERGHLYPHREILGLLVDLHQAGIPYALCSDMYLPSTEIHGILREGARTLGMELPPPRAVLVSGEVRSGKAGNLFRLLAETTGVSPSRILHLGDNHEADVVCARRAGLRALHLPRTCAGAEEILDAEEDWMPAEVRESKDFGLSFCRKEIFAEAANAGEGISDPEVYGAFVGGPIYASFAAWAIGQFRTHGITRVHCAMREGAFLARLLAAASSAFDYPLEIRTFWASRFALRSASLAEATPAKVEEFLRNVRDVDVRSDLLQDIGVLDKASAAEWTGEGLDFASPAAKLEWIRGRLNQDKGLLEAVSRRGQERADALCTHWKKSGLLENPEVTLLDVGWGGTIQLGLALSLRSMGWRGIVSGFYLGTDHRIDRLSRAGCPWHSYLYRAGVPFEPARIVQRTPEIIEQMCMSPQGSLREFTPAGDPVLFENQLPAEQLWQTARLQEGIMAFAKLWWPRFIMAGGDKAVCADRAAFEDRMRAIISRSIMAPRKEEVFLFRTWQHDSNNGSSDHMPILGSEEAVDMVKRGAVNHPWQLDWQLSYWPQALFLECNRDWSEGVSWRTRLLTRMGQISSRVFGRHDPWPRVLRVWVALRLAMRHAGQVVRLRISGR